MKNILIVFSLITFFCANSALAQTMQTATLKVWGNCGMCEKKIERAGSNRSGVWVGGGNIHGPKPRDYRQDMPKKMRQLARRSALALKVKSNEIIVIQDLNFQEKKTKNFANFLKAINPAGKKSLILVSKTSENVYYSGRNVPKCLITEAGNASTYELLNNQILVIEQSAIDTLKQQLS